MITLDDPIRLGSLTLLRDDERPDVAWHLPPPPAPLGGRPGEMTLFRHEIGGDAELAREQSRGGATLAFAFDLGALAAEVAAKETRLNALPTAPQFVRVAPVGAGEVRLESALGRLASTSFEGGVRPVVGVSAVVGVKEATLLRAAMEDGRPALWAVLDGRLPVRYGGPTFRIDIRGAAAARALGGEGSLVAPREVGRHLDRLLEDRHVELVTRATSQPDMDRLFAALVAGALLEPAGGGEAWSGVPGWSDAPTGALRVRAPGPDRQIGVESGLGEEGAVVSVPCFAVADVTPPAERIARVETPRSTVVLLRVQGVGPAERVASDLEVELDLPDGRLERVVLERASLDAPSPRWVRFNAGPEGPFRYRWRYAGGPWSSTDRRNLMLDGGPDRLRSVVLQSSGIDWTFIRSATVTVQLDPGAPPQVLTLTAEQDHRTWEYRVGDDRDDELTWRVSWEMVDGRRIDSDETHRGNSTIPVLSPFVAQLSVRFVALGEVDAPFEVDVAYDDDANDWHAEGTITLGSDDREGSFETYVLDAESRTWRYRVRRPGIEPGEWITTDNTVVVLPPPTTAP